MHHGRQRTAHTGRYASILGVHQIGARPINFGCHSKKWIADQVRND